MKISNIGLAVLFSVAAPIAMSSATLGQTTPGSSAASGSVAQSPGTSAPVNSTDTSAPSSTSGTSIGSGVAVDGSKNAPTPNSATTTTTSPRKNVTDGSESNRDNMAKGKMSQSDMIKKEGAASGESIRGRNTAVTVKERTSGKELKGAERHRNRSTFNRSTHNRRNWAGRHQGRRWVGTGPAIGFGFGLGESQYGNRYYDNSFAFSPSGDDEAYCAARFRSYDPTSGTYLGYDGLRHSCP